MSARLVTKLLAPLRRRLSGLVTRVVVSLVNDARLMQSLQVRGRAGEVLDGVEHFQHYGFTSVPFPGAEGVALAVGGHRAHTVVINVDDRRYRLKSLEPGEAALYTDEGDTIALKRGRIIAITAGAQVQVTAPDVTADCETATVKAAQSVRLDTPACTVTGELTVEGAIIGQGGMAISGGSGAAVEGNVAVTGGDVTADGISLKGHTHPGDSGGTTGPAQ